MSTITKVKIIAAAVAAIALVTSVICLYVYINNLNNKVTDMSVTISDQKKVIDDLNCQINALEMNVESFRETINITNDYIASIEKIRAEESSTKQEIYQEVINDPEAKSWYDESIPQSILDALARNANNRMCEDNN